MSDVSPPDERQRPPLLPLGLLLLTRRRGVAGRAPHPGAVALDGILRR